MLLAGPTNAGSITSDHHVEVASVGRRISARETCSPPIGPSSFPATRITIKSNITTLPLNLISKHTLPPSLPRNTNHAPIKTTQ